MIINSMLQTDLYKLSMQNFVLHKYADVEVEYEFNNRDKSMKYNEGAFAILKNEIDKLKQLRLTNEEYDYIKSNITFLGPMYRQYLSNYRYNPKLIDMQLLNDGQLQLKIKGKWRECILFEVCVMALISEIYFKYCDTNWTFNEDEQIKLAEYKAKRLTDAGCIFSDFGTRRRRNSEIQDLCVKHMSKFSGFMGTSNPYLAMKYGVKCYGSVAHEVICAISALESMNHPNKYAMELWADVYKAQLGTYLPDTYGLESFFKDFDYEKATYWQSLRHDSGCPFDFTDKVINHYNKLKIDPMLKTIIFSDSLDVDKAIKINDYCKGKIKCAFGIGTHLVSDFKTKTGSRSKPMNMVIKLVKCNGVNVCKLSCNPEKAIGHPDAVKMMNHIHFGLPL
jgi:nicotinate phosphoribosyltransferase